MNGFPLISAGGVVRLGRSFFIFGALVCGLLIPHLGSMLVQGTVPSTDVVPQELEEKGKVAATPETSDDEDAKAPNPKLKHSAGIKTAQEIKNGVADPNKIGRYGPGFNAAFHVADTVSFVSGPTLAIFAPHGGATLPGGVLGLRWAGLGGQIWWVGPAQSRRQRWSPRASSPPPWPLR